MNETNFHQTEDCPLLNGQLLMDIGFLGEGPQVENVLRGTYAIPADTLQGTQVFDWRSEYLKQKNTQNCQRVETSERTHGKWQTALYGHFEAGGQHDYIGWLDYMSAVPFTSGCSPRR